MGNTSSHVQDPETELRELVDALDLSQQRTTLAPDASNAQGVPMYAYHIPVPLESSPVNMPGMYALFITRCQ